ncbi:cell division protein ZipA C-terminal FtsZ-binding domain-containing protein [Hydrogenophaga sp.]|uniref:cell division protein ZipA C-terminal FtsZ-binding domain-containing protein n=1 Tax=Hydrogenophaga sp. TaxID=1904254 RepID=UPI00271E65BB|nr:cell division protein ZipA C-terminal FtsZ-binding domain-containing protein [Hydrogenophaga sp.]MDO9438754.1 cell division protein ZipA C-terminal FtsZ-binding domain-containing protein [Hydrogenophaga sp.]
MSTLQIGLAIIGGLVLAGVVAYNAWVTNKNAPRTARERVPAPGGSVPGPEERAGDENLPFAPADVTESDVQRVEPVFGDEPGVPDPVEPAEVSMAAASVGISPLVSQPPEKRPGLDALIDVIAPLVLEHEVSGDALLAALPGTRRVGSKPFAVEGQSETTGEWESPRLGQRYRALQAGVQLANRSGPLNDIEFSEFVVKAQAFADAVGASPDFPDMRAEVLRARELDAFASGHDAQLGFMLRARRTSWSPGYVAQHAAKLGFVAGALPGRMVLATTQSGNAPILSLVFDSQAAMAEDPEQSALREIALSLEVTHVPRSEQPFLRMRQAATALAEAMEGVVTDDGGQLLPTEALDQIGTDLESLYDALDSRDLSAGSPQARRLFS